VAEIVPVPLRSARRIGTGDGKRRLKPKVQEVRMVRSVLLAAMAVFMAASAIVAQEPPAIPVVKTLDDLRKAPPVALARGQELRIGVTEGAESFGGRLLYCLLGESRPDASDPGGDPEAWLGPLMVRIIEGRDGNEVTGALPEAPPPRGGESFCCTLVPTPAIGTYHVELVEAKGKDRPAERVVMRSTIEVKDATPCYWHRFAVAADGDGDRLVMMPQPTAARPRFAGATEFGWPADSKGELALDGLDREQPLELSVDLSVAEPQVHVKASSQILDSAKDHLLARWWVNGKPIAASSPEAKAAKPQGWRMSFTKELSMPLVLPKSLGALKEGDKVSVQLLYCPAGIKPCYAGKPPASKQQQFIPRIISHPASLPRASNVVEIVVTKELSSAG
jgi:hypothetical protein